MNNKKFCKYLSLVCAVIIIFGAFYLPVLCLNDGEDKAITSASQIALGIANNFNDTDVEALEILADILDFDDILSSFDGEGTKVVLSLVLFGLIFLLAIALVIVAIAVSNPMGMVVVGFAGFIISTLFCLITKFEVSLFFYSLNIYVPLIFWVIPLFFALAGAESSVFYKRYYAANNKIDTDVANNETTNSKPRLMCVAGEYVGAEFEIGPNEMLVIGRDPLRCNIVLAESNEKVSRKHCAISYNSEKDVYLVNDFSSNGTFVAANRKLMNGVETELSHGTQLIIGNSKNVFMLV